MPVFPVCAVLSGQSIYNTYLNLYLSSEGLSDSQIGFYIISVSTLFILLAQLFWGWVSDRVKVKNRILELLYLATAVISLLFYVGSSFWFLLAAVTFLFSLTPSFLCRIITHWNIWKKAAGITDRSASAKH